MADLERRVEGLEKTRKAANIALYLGLLYTDFQRACEEKEDEIREAMEHDQAILDALLGVAFGALGPLVLANLGGKDPTAAVESLVGAGMSATQSLASEVAAASEDGDANALIRVLRDRQVASIDAAMRALPDMDEDQIRDLERALRLALHDAPTLFAARISSIVDRVTLIGETALHSITVKTLACWVVGPHGRRLLILRVFQDEGDEIRRPTFVAAVPADEDAERLAIARSASVFKRTRGEVRLFDKAEGDGIPVVPVEEVVDLPVLSAAPQWWKPVAGQRGG
jgi:hypothetical protein